MTWMTLHCWFNIHHARYKTRHDGRSFIGRYQAASRSTPLIMHRLRSHLGYFIRVALLYQVSLFGRMKNRYVLSGIKAKWIKYIFNVYFKCIWLSVFAHACANPQCIKRSKFQVSMQFSRPRMDALAAIDWIERNPSLNLDFSHANVESVFTRVFLWICIMPNVAWFLKGGMILTVQSICVKSITHRDTFMIRAYVYYWVFSPSLYDHLWSLFSVLYL